MTARPWRAPALLATPVALAHLLLLGAVPAPLQAEAPAPAVRMTVRQLQEPPAQPPGTVAAVRHPSPPPRRRSPTAPAMQPAAPQHEDAPAAPAPVFLQVATSAHAQEVASGSRGEPGASPAAASAAVMPPARLHYEVRASTHGVELSGQGVLDWRHDGQQYEARLELRVAPLPTRTQRSTGRITPQGLAPTRFSERRRSEEAVHFDRGAGKLVFSNNRPQAELEPGAQDRLSVMLQLGALLAAGARPPAVGDGFAFQVAGVRDADPWTFSVEQVDELLHLPGGAQRTVRLLRGPVGEHDLRVELWLAPALAYAPVRLRLTQATGEWVEQRWSGTDRP